MADDADFIAVIYDAIINPSCWDEVVKGIVEATKSVSGGRFVQAADSAQLSAMHNVDPFYAKAFVDFWHKHNPLAVIGTTNAPGELRSGTHITQTDTFKASGYYNEFMRPQGWADSVLRGPNSFGHLVVQISPEATLVEPKEWHLLETLAPHLKRAAEVHQLLARERGAKESLGAAVAAAGFAAYLLTGDCRVVFANPKAEDLVRRGAGLRRELALRRRDQQGQGTSTLLFTLLSQSQSRKEFESHTHSVSTGTGTVTSSAPTASASKSLFSSILPLLLLQPGIFGGSQGTASTGSQDGFMGMSPILMLFLFQELFP